MDVTQLSATQDSQVITTIEDMKSWITNRGPLITCFSVYTDFYAYTSGIYIQHSGDFEGGHCVCCIGYDDIQQAWLCKNSWGTSWGESGYFWIGYGQCGIDSTMWAIGDFAMIYSSAPEAGSPLTGFTASDGHHVYSLGTTQHVNELWYDGHNWRFSDLTVQVGKKVAVSGSALIGFTASNEHHVYYLSSDSHLNELWFNGSTWLYSG